MHDMDWKTTADIGAMREAPENPTRLFRAFIWNYTHEGPLFWRNAATCTELPPATAARLREMIAEMET